MPARLTPRFVPGSGPGSGARSGPGSGPRSSAATRAVPIAEGAPPPDPEAAARAGFGERAGQTAEILTQERRLLLIRCNEDLEAAGALAAAKLAQVPHIAIDARAWPPEAGAQFAAGAVLRAWTFHRYVTQPDPDRPQLAQLDILTNDPEAAEQAWSDLSPGIQGALFARDLVAEPGNQLTPALFAARLAELRSHGIDTEILGPDRLALEGFGGLLAVGRASANPPCLAILRWPGGTAAAAPLLLVGKGVTFDTGGVSIKPADHMWEMRADMAGAAACAGAVLAASLRRSPVPVTAVLPLAENAVGAGSFRPGDVLRMQSGLTVEIVDTDAEGRLILADALSWSIAAIRPQAVIDLATLTGSIVTALGHHRAGLFATDDALAAQLAAAGDAVHEPVWRMPLDDAYGDPLESDIADLRQCSDARMNPDACLAAHFLGRFAGGVPWAHLDIAGVEARETATDRHPAGPTGWGARLLDRFIRDHRQGAALDPLEPQAPNPGS